MKTTAPCTNPAGQHVLSYWSHSLTEAVLRPIAGAPPLPSILTYPSHAAAQDATASMVSGGDMEWVKAHPSDDHTCTCLIWIDETPRQAPEARRTSPRLLSRAGLRNLFRKS